MILSGAGRTAGPGLAAPSRPQRALRAPLHKRRQSGVSRLAALLSTGVADLFSIEASFTLFLFSGRYKTFPELRWFPIDFTLLFFVVTFALIVWALVSGRMRPFPLSLPVLLVILFTEFAGASLFWSSLDPFNKDKLVRFATLTSTSFLAAHMIAPDKERRDRLVRTIAWLSAAILLYYVYYRYVLGIDVQTLGSGYFPPDSDNYLEYNSHANILFIFCIALAVFGSWKQTCIAVPGAGVMLFLLATIGGRGPLVLALLAVPLMGLGLCLRPYGIMQGLTRLSMFVAALCVMGTVTFAAMVQVYGSETWEQLRTLDRYEMQVSSEDTSSLDQRQEVRDLAYWRWREKPIFGWGIGEFRVQSEVGYPHNMLLEILMEMGLVGAFIFFPVCLVAVIRCVRVAQARSSGWTEIAMALLFLTELVSHLTVQGYLADDRYFFAYLGLLVGMGPPRRAASLRVSSRKGRPAVGYERADGQAVVARR